MVRWRGVGLLAVLGLVLVSACTWPMDRYGPGRTGHNPFERAVGTANVADLEPAFSGTLDWPDDVVPSVVVVKEHAFVAHTDRRLYAFSSTGDAGCLGAPAVCDPLWTATIAGPVWSTPAVAGDVVYVATEDGTLAAFSALGTTGCSGSPTVCSPLWTASTGDSVSSPLVVGGVVYLTAGDHILYAFDAAGQSGCGGTPRVCQPLWTAPLQSFGDPTPPAFADGTVFVTSGEHLYAFDADGVTNCSNGTCAPLWTATPECTGGTGCSINGPVVEGGTVFVGSDHTDEFQSRGGLDAYDAAGQVNCSGVPRSCEPLWSAVTRTQLGSLAVANGAVYLIDSRYDFFHPTLETRLVAFDAAGTTNCVGAPAACSPLWSAPLGNGALGSPSVANGVVYVASGGAILAFDAEGLIGCSGAPIGCAPLWTSDPLVGVVRGSPTVVNGRLYIGERGALRVFALPA